MTDAEIIKVLEEKIKFQEFDESEYAVIKFETLKDTLDLINRQKERDKEITERFYILGQEYDALYEMNESQEAEIKRLEKENISFAKRFYKEGVKDLAERMKEEARYFAANVPDVCEIIDNLTEELVGDER